MNTDFQRHFFVPGLLLLEDQFFQGFVHLEGELDQADGFIVSMRAPSLVLIHSAVVPHHKELVGLLRDLVHLLVLGKLLEAVKEFAHENNHGGGVYSLSDCTPDSANLGQQQGGVVELVDLSLFAL